MGVMEFTKQYIEEVNRILEQFPSDQVEAIASILAEAREKQGRIFILGVGGSAASASHMVNDLRKITLIETYAPTDNVAELTARTNDEGWASCFAAWLKGSHIRENDVVFVLSVGGGDAEKNISPNLVEALVVAKDAGAKVVGVVGRDGGYTAKVADACVIIPVINPDHITPHTESFHSMVGHMLVSHPKLKAVQTKWESAVK